MTKNGNAMSGVSRKRVHSKNQVKNAPPSEPHDGPSMNLSFVGPDDAIHFLFSR